MSDSILTEGTQPASEPVQQVSTTEVSSPVESNSWLSSIPEDLKADPSLSTFKDVGSLAKSYVEARRMLGSSIRIPHAESSEDVVKDFYSKITQVPGVVKLPSSDSPEEMQAFYKQLGRPDKPEEYQVEIPETYPVDADTYSQFTHLAHNLGLTNKQMQELIKYETERYSQGEEYARENLAQSKENCIAHLKQRWGEDFDNRLSGAKAAMKHYEQVYGKEMVEHLNASGAGSNPMFIEMLSDMYATSIAPREGNSTEFKSDYIKYNETPIQAQSKIEEIRSGRHVLSKDWLAGKPAALEEMKRLYGVAYGDYE